MKLIDNWRDAPRMYVMQVLALIAILQAAWAELPPQTVAELPAGFVHYATVALALLAMIGRVIKQVFAAKEQGWPEINDPPPPTTKETP